MHFRSHTPDTQRGFTIVELLVVIVVIGILAAITIVAYNGIQDRARFSDEQLDLKNIRSALLLYKADNAGKYPTTGGAWFGWDQVTGDSFIPGLSPKYISVIPQMDTSLPSNDSYLYLSNGTDYSLIRYRATAAGGLPQSERNIPRSWYGSPTEGWGYWSSGYSTDRPSD